MKPCPFCGNTNLEIVDAILSNDITIHCAECHAEGPTAETEKDAITKWDQRKEVA